METVPLGKSGLRISRLGLGGVPFGREIDETTSWDILDYALSRGITLIDTAEAYGGGNSRQGRRETYHVDDQREVSDEMHSSEKIIGRWMKARGTRSQVTLCTKFSTGGTREQVNRSLKASLERLQTDFVEIYMFHCPFPDVPVKETLEALAAEVRAGRIRALGCSNFSVEQLREAQAVTEKFGLERLNAVQPGFSLADASIRAELLPYCREAQIAAMTYSPLAAGFLSGKYSPAGEIPKGTRFDISPAHGDIYFKEENFRILEELRRLSRETGQPMTRLALAWVCAEPGVSSVLIGARTRAHIDTALDALSPPLNPELKKRMDGWLPKRKSG